MKKTLIALASVAALGAAHADVTLYGVLDAGYGTSSANLSNDVNNPSNANIYPATGTPYLNSVAGRTTGAANGLLQPSRWGLKGTENIGNGLTGMFTLESGLNIWGGNNPNDHALLAGNTASTGAGDSSLNGQMFDREASVGIKGDFGQIQAGFQLNLLGEAIGVLDPIYGGYISPMGTYGGLTGMGSSYTGRQSNSIKYKYTYGTSTLAAFYGASNVSGNSGAGAQIGFSAISDITPTIKTVVAYGKMNDNVAFGSGSVAPLSSTSAAVASGSLNGVAIPALGATYYNSTEIHLGGVYQATPALKVSGGYINIVQSNPSNVAADVSVTANLGVPIAGNALNTSPYSSNLTTKVGYLGAKYDVTENDHATLAYYQRSFDAYTKGYNSGSSVVAVTGSGSLTPYAANTQNVWVFVYDHDLSKKTDVYFAANFSKFDSNGVAQQTCASTAATATNQPAACSAAAQNAGVNANGQNGTLSQWGNLAGMSISYFGVGLRMKF